MKISIITPSFNQGKFLRKNIESIHCQWNSNLEHIIVDGGSSDSSLSILQEYSHIKYIYENDKGQSDAFNKGFKISTGQIIGWINSDDYLSANAIDLVVEYFINNPEICVVTGDLLWVNKEGDLLSAENVLIPTYHTLLYDNPDLIRQPSTFIRRSVFDDVGLLRVDLDFILDYELFLRIFKKYHVGKINKPLAAFRYYSDGKSTKFVKKQIKEFIKVLNEYKVPFYKKIWFYLLIKYIRNLF